MKQKFLISGMSCAACSARVQKAAAKLPGIYQAEVNLLANSLTVEYDAQRVNFGQIIAAVKAAGYGAQLWPENTAVVNTTLKQQETVLRRRFIGSLCFLLPLLYISMGPMWHWPFSSVWQAHLVWWGVVQLVLTLPVLWINRTLLINGFQTLFRGSPNMNSLIALGSTASVVYSLAVLLGSHRQHPAFYFESAAMILTLITLGNYLESRAKRKTSGAVAALLKLTPQKALRLQKGKIQEIAAEDIKEGDLLVVKAGMSVPADGIIYKGYGALNEAALTGESLPVDKTVGALVRAGTVSTDGYFEFKATQVGQETLLGRMITLVEEASASKAPIGRLADKISGVFVPVVIGLSLLTAVVWLLCGAEMGFAIRAAVAVLVISCPCALGLATPTAIMVGTGAGARRGILFKSAEVLETARQVQVVLLDKTGTVTQGQPAVAEVKLALETKAETFWPYVAAVESVSTHPLARAIVRAPQAQTAQKPLVEHFEIQPGAGVKACVNGKEILIGNAGLLQQAGIKVATAHEAYATAWEKKGYSVLYAAIGGVYQGMLGLADPLKDNAQQAVFRLQQMGLEVILLTGDSQNTADEIARQLDIQQVIAQVLPQEKELQVRRLQTQGKKVAMVGDGINDAAALARAEVGFALGSATEVALETADIVLVKDDLQDVVAALELSRAVMRNIKQNLFWAFFYNLLGIPLAAGVFYYWLGWQLNPMFAAAAMSLSSVSVVSNALRLRKFGRHQNIEKESKHMKTITIEGMMCAHCAEHVKEALEKLGLKAEVDLSKKQAIVPAEANNKALTAAIENAGYKVIDIK